MTQDVDVLLKRLHLANTRRIWRNLVEKAEEEKWSYEDFLQNLTREEVAHRQQTRLQRHTAKARFPFVKTIDEYDWTFQTSLRLTMLGSFLSPDFVTEGRCLILHGEPGRGKTHLAIAIAYRAIQNGYEAYFTTAASLIDDLTRASMDGRLREALGAYVHPHVLVIDEVGYLTYGKDAANVLFHVVNERHQKKRSMVFTTNKPLNTWGSALHDQDLAAAIVDRVLERGRLLHLQGPSYRTRHLSKGEAEGVKEPAIVSGTDRPQFPEPTNGWLWTIVSKLASVYEIHDTRGKNAITSMLPGFEGVIVRDAWDPYDQLTKATHQLDILHVNRWFERAEVTHGIEPRKLVKVQSVKFTRAGRPPKELLKFIDGCRERFREAILFVDKEPGSEERERAHARHRHSMRRFLNRSWKDPDAVRIRNELRSRIDMLFTFVRIPGVPWHNNDAERAIRQGVLHRKISGGRRTWPGAATLHTLLSVYETCKKTGQNFLDLARGLLAPHAPPSARPQS